MLSVSWVRDFPLPKSRAQPGVSLPTGFPRMTDLTAPNDNTLGTAMADWFQILDCWSLERSDFKPVHHLRVPPLKKVGIAFGLLRQAWIVGGPAPLRPSSEKSHTAMLRLPSEKKPRRNRNIWRLKVFAKVEAL